MASRILTRGSSHPEQGCPYMHNSAPLEQGCFEQDLIAPHSLLQINYVSDWYLDVTCYGTLKSHSPDL